MTQETPRILIVEDEFITAADLEMELQQIGYDVVGSVGSGEEAIESAELLKPDLVLMDIMLSGEMDGIAAAKVIREKHSIPVIFLTANSDDSVVDRARSSEPFGFLLKPFEQRLLRTNIEMALYKGRMDRERQDLIRQLQAALAEVKTLSGMLPICAWCKRVRDDGGYWQQVESYVSQHTEVEFSHGVCPDCAKTHFPGISTS